MFGFQKQTGCGQPEKQSKIGNGLNNSGILQHWK